MIRTVLVLSAAVISLTGAARERDVRVLLRDVTSLTLRNGEFTNYRRVAPVQQLTCKRGCNSRNEVDEMQCVNAGFDGYDVNWKCESNLPMGSKLSNVNIQCEGYEHPDDPFILAGSCGATYELIQSNYAYLDEEGGFDKRYKRIQNHHQVIYDDDRSQLTWPNLLLMAFVGFIFYNVFCPSGLSGGSSGGQYTASPSSYGNWGGSRGWGFSPFGGGAGGFFSGLGLGTMMGSMWGQSRRSPGWGWRNSWGNGWGYNQPSLYGRGSYSGSNYSGTSSYRSVGGGQGGSRQTSTSYATTSRR